MWVEVPESNTQGLTEEAINVLISEADPYIVVLADWDVAERNAHSLLRRSEQ